MTRTAGGRNCREPKLPNSETAESRKNETAELRKLPKAERNQTAELRKLPSAENATDRLAVVGLAADIVGTPRGTALPKRGIDQVKDDIVVFARAITQLRDATSDSSSDIVGPGDDIN